MKTEGNEPAFAVTDGNYQQIGLTKREYFAAMAMQGMLALSVNVQSDVAAESAIMYADALIEALNK